MRVLTLDGISVAAFTDDFRLAPLLKPDGSWFEPHPEFAAAVRSDERSGVVPAGEIAALFAELSVTSMPSLGPECANK